MHIREHLAGLDATNAEAQRDLGVSFQRLGDVLIRLGKTKEAFAFYQRDLQITIRLAGQTDGFGLSTRLKHSV